MEDDVLYFRTKSNFRLIGEVVVHCSFRLKVLGMQPGGALTCRKCRSGLASGGDTWCKFCSCAKTLSDLANHKFHAASFRAFSEESLYQCVRQIQGVIELDKAVQSQVVSLTDRLNNVQSNLNQYSTAAPKFVASRTSSSSRRAPPVKEEPAEEGVEGEADFGGDSYSTEEEDKEAEVARDEKAGIATALGRGGDRQPKSPDHPPQEGKRREERQESRSRTTWWK